MEVIKKFKSWNKDLAPEKKLKYVATSGMLSWAYIWALDMVELYGSIARNAGSLSSEQINYLTAANTGTTILFLIYVVVFLGIPGIADFIEAAGKIGFDRLGENNG